MAFQLVIHSEAADNEPYYSRSVAAQLARISLDLLEMCEQERLIQARLMAGGGHGFSSADIRNLARIRRLREDLELDLSAVEVVLHMRRRMVEMLAELSTMERRMAQQEQELLREIQRLRRQTAEDADWR
jgi:DNA-binding transcriptional MerR regulator